MAEPTLTRGTLYIDRDRDVLSGEWGQYIKIGIVRNERDASRRSKEHQTGNPRRIHVIYSAESPMVENLETQLHHIFATHRVLGEWFQLDDQSVETKVIPEAERIIEYQKSALEAFRLRMINRTEASSGIIRDPTEEEIKLHEKVVNAKHAYDIQSAKQEILKGMLIDRAKNSSGIDGVLELQKKINKPSLQKSKLKTDLPELYRQYESTTLEAPSGSVIIKGTSTLKKLDSALYDEKKNSPDSSLFVNDNLEKPMHERDPTIVTLHDSYLRNLSNVIKADWQYQSLKAELAKHLGIDEGIAGLISWKRVTKDKLKFNETRFANDHPKLYHDYRSPESTTIACIISPSRPYK